MTSGGKPIVLGHVLSAACSDGLCPQYGRDPHLDKEFVKTALSKSEQGEIVAFLQTLEGVPDPSRIPDSHASDAGKNK
jgi:hypothetical protein